MLNRSSESWYGSDMFFFSFCSPVSPITNVAPLSMVLFISLVKEAFEDWVSFQSSFYEDQAICITLTFGRHLSNYCWFFFSTAVQNNSTVTTCWHWIFLVLFCFLLDYVQQKRFQNDLSVNNSLVDVLQGQRWETIPWKRLQVGDIVRVSVCLLFIRFTAWNDINCVFLCNLFFSGRRCTGPVHHACSSAC